jgi:hypothetical protein
MVSNDDDASQPERHRTASRRWMIGIVLSLVFGIFGAVMALLSYMDRNRQTTVYRTGKSSPAAPAGTPGASPPAAPAVVTPSASPPPAPAESSDDSNPDKGKGNDKK